MCFLCLTGVVVFTVRGSNNADPGVLFLHSNVSNRVVNDHPHFADVSGVIFTVTSSNNSSCRQDWLSVAVHSVWSNRVSTVLLGVQ